jgi:hypothetical protein
MSIFSCITGIEANMLLIIFLYLITKLALISSDSDVGSTKLNNLDWTRLVIGVLTGLM